MAFYIYVLFQFKTFLKKNPQKSKIFNLKIIFIIFQYGPISKVLRWHPSWISDQHNRPIFCNGPSKEHFSHVCCQAVLRFLIRIIKKYFPHRYPCYIYYVVVAILVFQSIQKKNNLLGAIQRLFIYSMSSIKFMVVSENNFKIFFSQNDSC